MLAVLGEAPDVLTAPPLPGPHPVGVGGHDEVGVVHGGGEVVGGGGVAQRSRWPSTRPAAAASTTPSPLPDTTTVQTLARTIGLGVLDRDQGQRGDVVAQGAVRLQGERLLVDHGRRRRVGGRQVGRLVAVGDRCTEAVGRLAAVAEERPRGLGPWGLVALEGRLGGDQHGVRAEEPGHGTDRGPLGHAGLEAVVEGVERVHRGGAAEGQEVAGDEGAVADARQHRVDGVTPPVGRELHPRHLEDPVALGHRVQVATGVGPPRRHVLGSIEVRVHEAARPRRRQVEHGQHHHRDPGQQPHAGPVAGEGGHERPGAQCQSEHDHGDGPGAGAQGEHERGSGRARQRGPEGRGVVDGIGADGQEHPGGEAERGEAPLRPAHHHEAGHADQRPGRSRWPAGAGSPGRPGRRWWRR